MLGIKLLAEVLYHLSGLLYYGLHLTKYLSGYLGG